jgi:hypothetical protein
MLNTKKKKKKKKYCYPMALLDMVEEFLLVQIWRLEASLALNSSFLTALYTV